jgi:ATP synthase protein I
VCYNPHGRKKRDDRWDIRMNKKPPPSVWESLGALGGIGFTIVIPIVLGVILGNYIDGITHTKPLFLLLGLLLGLISGIYGVYRLLSRSNML